MLFPPTNAYFYGFFVIVTTSCHFTDTLCLVQRIYISDRRDGTPLRIQTFAQPALSDSLVVGVYCRVQTEQGEVGRVKCLEDAGGVLSLLSLIYCIFFG